MPTYSETCRPLADVWTGFRFILAEGERTVYIKNSDGTISPETLADTGLRRVKFAVPPNTPTYSAKHLPTPGEDTCPFCGTTEAPFPPREYDDGLYRAECTICHALGPAVNPFHPNPAREAMRLWRCRGELVIIEEEA